MMILIIKAVIINRLPTIDPKDNLSPKKSKAHKGAKKISLIQIIFALKAEIRTIHCAKRIPANAVWMTPEKAKKRASVVFIEISFVYKT